MTVFISSTCYDLLDLRAELVSFLEPKGFIVKVSEDPFHIDVEPTVNSIETCLRNVEASDVVVCILDRRYGRQLPEKYGNVSATHYEIKHARGLRPPKPVYIFMRDKAWAALDELRANPSAPARWVQGDVEEKKRWFEFAEFLKGLPRGEDYSNWADVFQSSVQLKQLALKRLSEFQRRMAKVREGERFGWVTR